MILYDSHACSPLLAEGKRLCIAGVCMSSVPQTLHAYSNMSCLMEYEGTEAQEVEEDGTTPGEG